MVKESTAARSSNFELLRVVAILLIICFHLGVHTIFKQLTDPAVIKAAGSGFFNVAEYYGRLRILDFVESR